MVRFKLKSITLKIKRGGGSRFLSSSFLNHDSKSRNEKQNKKKTQNQGKTALEKVRAQNITINNNICDACNECTYDACSNAQKARSIFQHSFNWLEQRVLTKNPKYWRTHFSKPNKIE